jgi:hypothetical protein
MKNGEKAIKDAKICPPLILAMCGEYSNWVSSKYKHLISAGQMDARR